MDWTSLGGIASIIAAIVGQIIFNQVRFTRVESKLKEIEKSLNGNGRKGVWQTLEEYDKEIEDLKMNTKILKVSKN